MSEPQSHAGTGEEDRPPSDALPVPIAQARVLRAADDRAGHEIEPGSASMMPAVQAAAVAAGGFVAGAAVAGLVHRRRRRAQLTGGRRSRRLHARRTSAGRSQGRAAELVQIVGSRSLLVDVHLLGGAGER